MKIKFLFATLLNLLGLLCYSQGEFVIEIDHNTGNFVKTGPLIPTVSWIYPDNRAFDESTGQHIFQSSQLDRRLYSIDVSNGSVAQNPLVDNFIFLEFDQSSHKLYGLLSDSPNNVKHFGEINRSTGFMTYLGSPVPGASYIQCTCSAYDQTGHFYFFLAPGNILYRIDASTGIVLSSPTLTAIPNQTLHDFAFDNTTGTLLALAYNSQQQRHFMATVDPATGSYTTYGMGSMAFVGMTGSSAIDEANQHFIFMGANNPNGFVVTTMDIATGNELQSHLMTQAEFPGDNPNGIKYDNVHHKLYAIFWDQNITVGDLEASTQSIPMTISPNPSSSFTKISIPAQYEGTTLTICNGLGQTVREIKNISENEILVEGGNLPNGLYFVCLHSQDRIIATEKWMLVD